MLLRTFMMKSALVSADLRNTLFCSTFSVKHFSTAIHTAFHVQHTSCSRTGATMKGNETQKQKLDCNVNSHKNEHEPSHHPTSRQP